MATQAESQSAISEPPDSADPCNDPQLFTHNPFSPSYSLSPWPVNFPSEQNVPTSYATDFATYDYSSHDPQDPTQNHHNPQYQQYNNAFSYGSADRDRGVGGAGDMPTPGAMSNNGSTLSENDKDPFLNLLEQLAENEHGRGDGPSDLDFFLSSQG